MQKTAMKSCSYNGVDHLDVTELPLSVLDDDYCDCSDGADEPHTAACERQFWCANVGSIPRKIRSTMVKDGLQDCCDASDEGGQGQGGCSKELAEVSERIAALLVTEQRGQALKEEMLESLTQQAVVVKDVLAKAQNVAQPFLEAMQKLQEKLVEVIKKREKPSKNPKIVSEAELVGPGRVQMRCYRAGGAYMQGGQAAPSFAELAVNASCLAAQECRWVCSYLCSDPRQFNGTCAVQDGEGLVNFAFDPDALRLEAMMAQYGRGEAGAIEAAAVDHLVVLEGWTTTDAKWLDLRQKLSRVQRKSAQLMEELQVAKTDSQMMDLIETGQLGPSGVYHNLHGRCLNLTQEQYVGTTAVREQWHTFFYSICFFKHVTQQELKHGPDAAAACDESGKCTTNDELAAESPVIFLGRPVGFVASVSNLKRLGLQEVFFEPSPHSLVFSGGQPCGPVQRATAVQFRCGVEEKVMRLEEVKTCMYLAEVQHPGACDLMSWPSALRQLSEEGLAQKVAEWLQQHAQELQLEGLADWPRILQSRASVQQWFSQMLPQREMDELLLPLDAMVVALSSTGAVLRDAVMAAATVMPEEITWARMKAWQQLEIVTREARTSTWPTLASHLNVEQLEDALAGLNDVLQGLENYGKKGVESCKEGFAAVRALRVSGTALAVLEGFEAQRPSGRRFVLPKQQLDLGLTFSYLLLLHFVVFKFLLVFLRHCCCCSCRSRPARLPVVAKNPVKNVGQAHAAQGSRPASPSLRPAARGSPPASPPAKPASPPTRGSPPVSPGAAPSAPSVSPKRSPKRSPR